MTINPNDPRDLPYSTDRHCCHACRFGCMLLKAEGKWYDPRCHCEKCEAAREKSK